MTDAANILLVQICIAEVLPVPPQLGFRKLNRTQQTDGDDMARPMSATCYSAQQFKHWVQFIIGTVNTMKRNTLIFLY